MEHNSPTVERALHIPRVVWVLGIGLVTAMIAIFFFNVAVNTVAYYGFLALMIGSHLFMHGGHGGHGGHAGHQPGVESDSADAKKNEPAGRSGGCH